jgi:hypothetical protein
MLSGVIFLNKKYGCMRLYKLYIMIRVSVTTYSLQNAIQQPRLQITQIWTLHVLQKQVELRTREVRPPPRFRVQTRVARTQASCLTSHLGPLRAAWEVRCLPRIATGGQPRAHVVCALLHKDRLVCCVSALRSHQASQSSEVERYTPRVNSTISDPYYVSGGSEERGKRGNAQRGYTRACER